MEQLPTWPLTERMPSEVPLTAADVDFLLTHHRPHLQLLPTRQSGWFRLTPTGHIGVIPAPHCRLLLQPKIPIRNVWYLLDDSVELPAATDSATAMPCGDVIDFLAMQLAQRMAERVRLGLRRGYRERAVSGAFLQGRLDVSAQMREPHGRKDQLHCQFDDFSVDVPCNQLPRATAERVLAWPLLSAAVRQSLRQSLTAFADVSAVALDEQLFAAAQTDRLNQDYRPLLDLCRLLAESLTHTPATGTHCGPAFLLNLERIFERFLLSRVAAFFDGSGGIRAEVQPWWRMDAPARGQPEFALRPDLTLQRRDRPYLVLDAKWKRLPATRLVTPDVYQVLAYCAALDVQRAVLVYPGRRDRKWEYRLGATPIRLSVRTLCLVGDRARLERSVQRLLRGLQQDVQ